MQHALERTPGRSSLTDDLVDEHPARPAVGRTTLTQSLEPARSSSPPLFEAPVAWESIYPERDAKNPPTKNTRDVKRPGLVTKQHVRFYTKHATPLKVSKSGALKGARMLGPGAEVLGNPSRPRNKHVLVWHNGAHDKSEYLGSGWVEAAALEGGAALLAAAKRVKQQASPRGTLEKRTLNLDCPVTVRSTRGQLYIKHGEDGDSNKLWHYMPQGGRVNVCRNLPQGGATAIANDVLAKDEPFFVEPGSERTVALFGKGSKRPKGSIKWVYGCMADGERKPDRKRPGWVPKEALRKR